MPLDRWKDVRTSILGLALRRQGYPVPTEVICRELTADGSLRNSYQKLLSRSISLAGNHRTPVDIASETVPPTQPGGRVPMEDEALRSLYHSAIAIALQAGSGRTRQAVAEDDQGGASAPGPTDSPLVALEARRRRIRQAAAEDDQGGASAPGPADSPLVALEARRRRIRQVPPSPSHPSSLRPSKRRIGSVLYVLVIASAVIAAGLMISL